MGQFQPGQSKPIRSGRKRGTPNKKSQHLTEVLDALKFNTVERLTELLPHLSKEKQADVLMGLIAYQFPKPKAVEIAGEHDLPAPEVVLIQLPANGRERKIKAQ